MILAAAVLATVLTPAPPSATLCIDDRCRDAALEIAAADAPRRFVWIAGDATRMIGGIIPAGALSVALDGGVAHKITLATSDGARSGAADFTLRCDEKEWQWSLAQWPRNAMTIVRPEGDCTIGLRADGYKAVEKSLESPQLGVVYLQRLPVISGIVTEAITRSPVTDAEILLTDGEPLATTDAAGRYRAAIDGAWPSRLRVEAPGRAPHTLVVPKAVADVELPVVLHRGGSVNLALAPPLGKEELRWEARRVIDQRTTETIRTGAVAAGESNVVIEGLDPGPFSILVMGEGPLQRIAVPVEVIDGVATEATVQIEPALLDLEVLQGGEPFARATLEIDCVSCRWRSTLAADDSGHAIAETWQAGRYIAGREGWFEWRMLGGEESIHWKLDIPDRTIQGRVRNAVTGQPLANVLVILDAKSGDSMSSRGTPSAADGSFEFRSMNAGTYTLTVRADGYEPLQTPSALLAEETHLEKVELALQPVTGHVLRAVNAFGAPIPSALVVISSARGERNVGVTGPDGRITLPLIANEHGVAFVLPRSGSFAVTPFAPMSETGAQELIATVPDGAASLEVRAESTEGEPIEGVGFLLRVNGMLLPPRVQELMAFHQGFPHASDATGRFLLSRLPQGRYELWPLASRADYLAVNSPSPPPAPVNVILMAGHQVAKMVFRSAAVP